MIERTSCAYVQQNITIQIRKMMLWDAGKMNVHAHPIKKTSYYEDTDEDFNTAFLKAGKFSANQSYQAEKYDDPVNCNNNSVKKLNADSQKTIKSRSQQSHDHQNGNLQMTAQSTLCELASSVHRHEVCDLKDSQKTIISRSEQSHDHRNGDLQKTTQSNLSESASFVHRDEDNNLQELPVYTEQSSQTDPLDQMERQISFEGNFR